MDFEIDLGQGVDAKGSCSVLFNGRMLILGGISHASQISEVTSGDVCSLDKVGMLDDAFSYPSCTVWNNSEILICFNNSDTKCSM